jgi:hypothetical protein
VSSLRFGRILQEQELLEALALGSIGYSSAVSEGLCAQPPTFCTARVVIVTSEDGDGLPQLDGQRVFHFSVDCKLDKTPVLQARESRDIRQAY